MGGAAAAPRQVPGSQLSGVTIEQLERYFRAEIFDPCGKGFAACEAGGRALTRRELTGGNVVCIF